MTDSFGWSLGHKYKSIRNTTNSIQPTTSGAIALRPSGAITLRMSGNEQGKYYFLSIHT